MRKHTERCAGVLLWLIAGAVIGGLVAALGGHTFQQHVRVFYPPEIPYSQLMHFIAGLGLVLRPVAWFGSMFGPMYYCYRHELAHRYIVLFGATGAVAGFLCSGYVHASPGPNFHTSEINLPAGVLVGCLLGMIVHACRGDWHDDETMP